MSARASGASGACDPARSARAVPSAAASNAPASSSSSSSSMMLPPSSASIGCAARGAKRRRDRVSVFVRACARPHTPVACATRPLARAPRATPAAWAHGCPLQRRPRQRRAARGPPGPPLPAGAGGCTPCCCCCCNGSTGQEAAARTHAHHAPQARTRSHVSPEVSRARCGHACTRAGPMPLQALQHCPPRGLRQLPRTRQWRPPPPWSPWPRPRASSRLRMKCGTWPTAPT